MLKGAKPLSGNVRKRRRILEEALGRPVDFKDIFRRSRASAKRLPFSQPRKKRKITPQTNVLKYVPQTHVLVLDNGTEIACPSSLEGYPELMVDDILKEEPASSFGPSKSFIRQRAPYVPEAYDCQREPSNGKSLRSIFLGEGEWIRVFWPTTMSWYRAVVKDTSPCIVVCYEDGEKEWLCPQSVFRLERDFTKRTQDIAPSTVGYANLGKPAPIPSVWNADGWNELDDEGHYQDVLDRPIHILNRSDYSWTSGIIREQDIPTGYLFVDVKCPRGKRSEHWIDPSVNECYISDDNGKKWKRREPQSPRKGPRLSLSRKKSFASPMKPRRLGNIKHRKMIREQSFGIQLPKPMHELPEPDYSPSLIPVPPIRTVTATKKRPKKSKKKRRKKKKSQSFVEFIPPSQKYNFTPGRKVKPVDIPRVKSSRSLQIPDFKVQSNVHQNASSPVKQDDCVFDATYASKPDSWSEERDPITDYFGVYEQTNELGQVVSWGMQLNVSPYYRLQEAGFTSKKAAAYARDKAILMYLQTTPENSALKNKKLNFPQHKDAMLNQMARDPNSRSHPNRIYLARMDIKSPFHQVKHPTHSGPSQLKLTRAASHSRNTTTRTANLDSRTDHRINRESSMLHTIAPPMSTLKNYGMKPRKTLSPEILMQPGTLCN